MPFYSRIFNNHRNKRQNSVIQDAPTTEFGQLLRFIQHYNSLLLEDKYIARSDYLKMLEEYSDVNTFLIVKPGKDEPFLGCTNYKKDKTGCDGFMTKQYNLKNYYYLILTFFVFLAPISQ